MTCPSASTWRMRSVAPSTMAPSSSRSWSSVSRRRAPVNATVSRGAQAGRSEGHRRRGPPWRGHTRSRITGSARREVRVRPSGTGRPFAPAQRRPATRATSVCRRKTLGLRSGRGPPRWPVRGGTARAGRLGQADELGEDRGAELGDVPAGGDELAELVLREERIGFALGGLEGSAPLALERRDRARAVGRLVELARSAGRRHGSGLSGRRAPAAGGHTRRHPDRVAGRALAESQSETRRATSGRVDRAPARPASTASAYAR